ncbi:dihydrolipoamide dehydrogenase [Magnetococcus marinus MC-1]|uniref:Dihydrolipoyl dehydrogenase n=1 Tax=Magnetococcus marinus (strain ATCC BAA-1437 / JCM 17883 / MC-1) TaxID=156889 RepID=A0L7L9_MAGMM|nr:dihydrolipoyl dehydrogenase [Magnetococcus marinus]ABK43962.1 dihydrolipoamide dehydrogenase [Magnetococcus marinus MC-1]
MMATIWDLIVIGAGPGGYPAAIRAAQLGLSVLCIEKSPHPGGTCLNAGCIPTKALLASTHLYTQIRDQADLHGIEITTMQVNLARMQGRKERVVSQLRSGILGLFKKYGVTLLHDEAIVSGPGQITLAASGETLQAKAILLATGGQPRRPASMPVDGQVVITSEQAIALTRVPEHLIVIGSGAVGLELASIWVRLGAQVSVIEAQPEILPGWDATVARTAKRSLRQQGITFLTDHRVETVVRSGSRAAVTCLNSKGETLMLDGDQVLVAVGRQAQLCVAGIQNLELQQDEQGRLWVDAHYATSLAGLYAVGDLIAGPQLAHRATAEGLRVADYLAGRPLSPMGPIPSVVYTDPELAMVGLTEQQAKVAGYAVKCGQFPFMASGRARAQEQTEGLIKLVMDQTTGQLLGAHVVGGAGAEHLQLAMAAMLTQDRGQLLERLVMPHPSFGEALHEAWLVATQKPIHI